MAVIQGKIGEEESGVGVFTFPADRNIMSIDQITIKTPNTKCRLYWCLIGFINWRDSQSWWYFRPLL
jgi:hypothetical protein